MIGIVFLTLALQSVYGQKCKPELSIQYNDGIFDQSGNKYTVKNSSTTVKNGMGVFDEWANHYGGSNVKVPMNTTLRNIQTLVIKTRYQALSSINVGNIITITPNVSPTDHLFLMFRNFTDHAVTVSMRSGNYDCRITIPKDNFNQTDFVNAVIKLQNGKLSLRLNNETEISREGCGNKHSIWGEILIGGDYGLGPLLGNIDYTEMYLCDPDEEEYP